MVTRRAKPIDETKIVKLYDRLIADGYGDQAVNVIHERTGIAKSKLYKILKEIER